MKRKLSILAFLAALSLSSCTINHSVPGKMDKIIGIYELQTMTRRDDQNNDYDAKAQLGAKSYLLIDGTEYGYSYYKDNTTQEVLDTILIEYGVDEEESKDGVVKYKNIEYWNGRTEKWAWDERPGGPCGETTMAVNVRKHTLSYTISSEEPKWYNSYHGIEYLDVTYKRVSTKTSFEEFKSITQTNLAKPLPFLLKNIGHWMCASNNKELQWLEDGEMHLMYFCFNDTYSKADFYINYKGEEENKFHKVENCTVSYEIGKNQNGIHELSVKVEGTNYFTSENNTFTATIGDVCPTYLFSEGGTFYSVYPDEAPDITVIE